MVDSRALEKRLRGSRPRWLGHLLTFFHVVLGSRLGWLGLAVLVVVVFAALGADLISPYDPLYQDYRAALKPPSLSHLLGTDDVGRDILSRLIHGSRVSLQVGLAAVGLAVVLGVLIGLVAGYWGGRVDEVLMRLSDGLYAFPGLILAMAIAAVLGPSIVNIMMAVGVVYIPPFARLVRASALSVREWDFITAARVLGASDWRIVRCHLWPNVTAPVIVQASLNVSYAILVEASLSFLGVGVRPPTPSWGAMLNVGYQYLELAPWLSLFPGATIFVTVLGLNLLGDGLRTALDPRMRDRGA